MYFKPRLCPYLLIKQKFPNPLRKDLCTSARHRPQSCILQLNKDLFDRKSELFMEEVDFHGRERFNVSVGCVGADPPQHVEIILPFPVGMESTCDMHLVNLRRQFREDFLY